jgi:hypothetical protein
MVNTNCNTMAIQRIGGQMLESNLTRVSDLAFQTDLLYLDVDNSRVGIRTAAPGNFALDVNGTARFQNSVSITGDLTVTGLTTVVNTTNMEIEDNILMLNNGGSTGNDAGIMINRNGLGNNAVFYWDEGAAKFKIVTTTSDGSTITNVTDSAYAILAAADPVGDDDVVTKRYFDANVSSLVELGSFTFSGNKITQTASNADFELDNSGTGNFVLVGSSGLVLPKGDTASRPTAREGIIRFNTETGKYEVSQDGSTYTNLRTEQTAGIITKDVFVGDGTTTQFTLTTTPTNANNVIVYVDGVMQEPTQNYVLAGNLLSFTAGNDGSSVESPHAGARVVVMQGFADA